MKILHTSDWHIGQMFYRFERNDESRHFFTGLCDVIKEERPDVMVVCGDIFHNPLPTASATRLFEQSMLKAHYAAPDMKIVITAGNHDNGARLEAMRELWETVEVKVIGGCSKREDNTFDPSQFLVKVGEKGYVIAIPYFHATSYPLAEADTPRECRQRAFFDKVLGEVTDTELPVVMMAHMAVSGCNTRGHEDDEPVGGMLKEDITELGDGYDYLALGHIHMPQKINERIYYCGSAMPVSFNEDYSHCVNIVEIERHGDIPSVRKIEIEALRKVKTIPTDGAPLAEALDALQALSDDDDSYVRLLVDQEEPLPADAKDRANIIAEGKQCRFCDIIKKPRMRNTADDEQQFIIHDVSDLKKYSPLEIATQSYLATVGVEMTPELKDMMAKVINKVVNHNENEA